MVSAARSAAVEPVVSKAQFSPEVAGYEVAEPLRLRAFTWAATHAKGCWYVWGAIGPCADGYDCSGTIYAAYTHVGVRDMPRDTYEMLASPKLRWVPFRDAKRGDLAFFGTGHVEMVAYAHDGVIRWTLGAREPGTTVSFYRIDGYFYPTAIYAVRT